VAYFGPALDRVRAILTTGYGETGYTIALGHFRLPPGSLNAAEPDASERAVEVRLGDSQPVGGSQNPLHGRDLRETAFAVRVGYLHRDEGSLDAGVDARVLGGASLDALDARASSDAAVILGAVGWQPNFAGLDPEVIDCAPDPRGWALTVDDSRGVLTVPFVLTTRATFPGAYGPSST
jgi:hypothetical protein